MTGVSAYVPSFNNAATVCRTLASLQRQTLRVDEMFLVDDGSTDGSGAVAEQLGVWIVSMEHNAGRGAVRATAMLKAQHELVLCCDATNYLPDDFMERAREWFIDPNVAAVFGRIWQNEAKSSVERWRGRHLFKQREPMAVQHGALLSTYGCVLRRSAVLAVGNFDSTLRHSEDADLGRRLLAGGFDVIHDPDLYVISGASNTVRQVLERYWRWHAGPSEDVSLYKYAKLVWYSLRVMVLRDLAEADFLAVPITLLCPHYQFWASWRRRRFGDLQLCKYQLGE